MGKDREGTFHPKKGKPSGEGVKKGNDAHSATVDEQIRIEEEYDINEDGQVEAAGVHVLHHNRNEDKSRERKKPDSRRGSITRKQDLQNNSQPERDNHVRKTDNTNENFFVLILSKKNAKFFRGDVSGLHHVDISELPNGVNDVVHLEEKDDQKGLRWGALDDKENVSMYLKEVDRTLWSSGLNKASAPLVVGGVDYICAMFKDISQYKNITDKCLTGSFENEDPKEIYKRAKQIVKPVTV